VALKSPWGNSSAPPVDNISNTDVASAVLLLNLAFVPIAVQPYTSKHNQQSLQLREPLQPIKGKKPGRKQQCRSL